MTLRREQQYMMVKIKDMSPFRMTSRVNAKDDRDELMMAEARDDLLLEDLDDVVIAFRARADSDVNCMGSWRTWISWVSPSRTLTDATAELMSTA